MIAGKPLFKLAETWFDVLSLQCSWLGFTFTSHDRNSEVKSDELVNGGLRLSVLVPRLSEHNHELLSVDLQHANDFLTRKSGPN